MPALVAVTPDPADAEDDVPTTIDEVDLYADEPRLNMPRRRTTSGTEPDDERRLTKRHDPARFFRSLLRIRGTTVSRVRKIVLQTLFKHGQPSFNKSKLKTRSQSRLVPTQQQRLAQGTAVRKRHFSQHDFMFAFRRSYLHVGKKDLKCLLSHSSSCQISSEILKLYRVLSRLIVILKQNRDKRKKICSWKGLMFSYS